MPSAMLVERWFFRTYHWTPDVVHRLDLEYLIWLPLIELAEQRAQEKHQRASAREQNRGRRGAM